MSENKRREFWIETDGDKSFQVVFDEQPGVESDSLIHVIEYDASREKVFEKAVMLLRAWRNSHQSEIHSEFCNENQQEFGACGCGLDERRKLSDSVLAAFEKVSK